MLIRRFLYTVAVLIIPFVLMGGSCSTDPNFSGNATSTLNITGNYLVNLSPDSGLTNMTLTQTGNLVQGVDNRGTLYEGTSTGDISTTSVQQTNTFVTTVIQITGKDSVGRTVSIILTSADIFVFVNATDVTVVATSTSTVQNTNIANAILVRGLFGTYTRDDGLAGAFELLNNSVQTDTTL